MMGPHSPTQMTAELPWTRCLKPNLDPPAHPPSLSHCPPPPLAHCSAAASLPQRQSVLLCCCPALLLLLACFTCFCTYFCQNQAFFLPFLFPPLPSNPVLRPAGGGGIRPLGVGMLVPLRAFLARLAPVCTCMMLESNYILSFRASLQATSAQMSRSCSVQATSGLAEPDGATELVDCHRQFPESAACFHSPDSFSVCIATGLQRAGVPGGGHTHTYMHTPLDVVLSDSAAARSSACSTRVVLDLGSSTASPRIVRLSILSICASSRCAQSSLAVHYSVGETAKGALHPK
eukprot:1160928-Pelagomonas_calceolata.AAC.7